MSDGDQLALRRLRSSLRVAAMSYVAPAGTPVTIRDLARGFAGAMRGPQQLAALTAALRSIAALPHAWPLSSGRAAITVALDAMRAAAGDSDRREVIVPAYTCYSVPACVERAGLRLRLCDVDPDTLSMDPQRLRALDFSNVLAVVSANLYGLPNDLETIESICRQRGVYLLDDAAQAMGASIAHRPVGSFGDAGLFSFDKGKVISTMQGGALVCRDSELASALDRAVATLPAATLVTRATNAAALGAYALFLRPALYPVVRALPFTGLGDTVYQPRFPIARLSAFSSAVATSLLARLDELASVRRRNAAALDRVIRGLPSVKPVRALAGAIAAYVRYPLRLHESAARAGLIAALQRAGIGATASYPAALCDVPEVRRALTPGDGDFPGARKVAATIVTLPTHAYCPPDMSDRVFEVIQACAS